jgi:hypothetical protein
MGDSMRRYLRTFLLICLCMLLFCSVCSANPAIFPLFPLSQAIIVLVAVVIIETLVFKTGMRTPYLKTGLAVGSANIVSAAVGLPLGLWAAGLNAIAMPSAVRFGSLWTLLLLSVSVLALSLILAVHLEYFVVRRFFRTVDRCKIRHLSWRANLLSYTLLLATLPILRLLYL